MLVGAALVVVAVGLLFVHPASAVFPAIGGAIYIYLGYHLRYAVNQQIVMLTGLTYAIQAVWFDTGLLMYHIKLSPGILVGIIPGALAFSIDVKLIASLNTARESSLVLGFDLLALIVLFYLIDQYPFVPKGREGSPPSDILDANS